MKTGTVTKPTLKYLEIRPAMFAILNVEYKRMNTAVVGAKIVIC